MVCMLFFYPKILYGLFSKKAYFSFFIKILLFFYKKLLPINNIYVYYSHKYRIVSKMRVMLGEIKWTIHRCLKYLVLVNVVQELV